MEKHTDISLPLLLRTFSFDEHSIQLYIPDPQAVKKQYQLQKETDSNTPFPYWAKIWPAALAMATFLVQHPAYIENKKVLELAAGLGLPSLIAARYAREVCCSDYIAEAVAIAKRSAAYNKFTNIYGAVLDWHYLPQSLSADILLLSDINYDPAAFETLYTVLTGFLQKGTTIILSTPQRLMAKSFVERLLPWRIQQQEIAMPYTEQMVVISILVLKVN